MNEVIDLIKSLDLHTIIVIGILFGYFTRSIEKTLGDKIDSLDRDVRAMNTRIGRLEGTVYGKDVYKPTVEAGEKNGII